MTRTTYAYWIRGRAYAELAAKSIESIKRFDRYLVERRFVVVSDDHPLELFKIGDILPAQTEFIVTNAGRPAMVANLDAQIEVLHNTPKGERVLFLDADTLAIQSFPWTDADMHATWRTDVNGNEDLARQQPWNYGVLGVNVTLAVIEAFIWLRARILKMAPAHQDWYGNQLALADLLGAARSDSFETAVRWSLMDRGTPLSVMPLPCSVWNYSPNGPDEDVSGKGILHMKGDRKDLIEHYATRLAA